MHLCMCKTVHTHTHTHVLNSCCYSCDISTDTVCGWSKIGWTHLFSLTHTHTQTYSHIYVQLRICVFSGSTLPDWFHHKIVLSSHPLKLWSHRYVCSNCSACTELFTSSSFSHTRFSLTLVSLSLLILYCILSSPVLLISSLSFCFPFLSPSYSCVSFISPPLVLTLSPSSFIAGFLSVLLFLLSSSSHSSSPFSPPPLPFPLSISSLSISLQHCQPWGESKPSLLFIY